MNIAGGDQVYAVIAANTLRRNPIPKNFEFKDHVVRFEGRKGIDDLAVIMWAFDNYTHENKRTQIVTNDNVSVRVCHWVHRL